MPSASFIACQMHVHPGGHGDKRCGMRLGHAGPCRAVESAQPGHAWVVPCVDCGHTRCGDDCTCACNAPRATS